MAGAETAAALVSGAVDAAFAGGDLIPFEIGDEAGMAAIAGSVRSALG